MPQVEVGSRTVLPPLHGSSICAGSVCCPFICLLSVIASECRLCVGSQHALFTPSRDVRREIAREEFNPSNSIIVIIHYRSGLIICLVWPLHFTSPTSRSAIGGAREAIDSAENATVAVGYFAILTVIIVAASVSIRNECFRSSARFSYNCLL